MAASNHRKTDLATFKALDDLPAELRKEICFAARVWDALDLSRLYRDACPRMGSRQAVGWLVASIRAGDEQDVLNFAHGYQLRHGTPLPHLAADATILRYQEVARPRLVRHSRCASADVRAAWRSSERLMAREGIDDEYVVQMPVDQAIEDRFSGLDLLPS